MEQARAEGDFLLRSAKKKKAAKAPGKGKKRSKIKRKGRAGDIVEMPHI